MKKHIVTKSVCLLLALLLLLSCGMMSAGAEVNKAGLSVLSVGSADTASRSDIGVTNWYYSSVDKSYYIFLPQTTDTSSLRVWYDADAVVYCGDNAIENGGLTDAFADGSCTLTCSGNTYRVNVLDGGDVASVRINTASGSLDAVHADKSYKEPGVIDIQDSDGTVQYSGDLDYIKGRGNSTWNGAKKPYNIKLAKKADLFGMGKAKKWCLLANAGDATLMRNMLSYQFAKSIGVDVTSDTIPVNLYINNNYMGAYLLTEKVEVGENRVDIYDLEKETEKVNDADLDTYPLGGDQDSQDANTYQYAAVPNNPDNITGGYLLELEKIYRYPPEAAGFISARRQAVVVKTPEYASKEQVEYIRSYYQDYEDAVYSQTGYNAAGHYYTDYVDVESIARMYITEEFCANFDGCSSSFYLYKDIDGKISAGPAWDFDLSFAQTKGINGLINTTCSTDKPNSLYIQNCFINYDNKSYNSFLAQLFSHNDFQEVVQRVWNDIVTAQYPSLYASVDQIAAKMSKTVIMNAVRWNRFGTTDAAQILSSYNSSLGVLKNYLPQRFAFLSKAYREDTYFVKYDIGAYGAELVHDTVIYHNGDTFTVQALPAATKEACCTAWYLSPDFTGTPVLPGSKLTVTGNTKLYAKWNLHQWQTSEADAAVQCCAVCGRFMENGELLEGWRGSRYYENGKMYRHGHKLNGYYYDFGEDGVYTGVKAEGVLRLGDGGYVYAEAGVAQAKGLVLHNGDYYYFGLNTLALTDGSYTLTKDKMNGLLPAGNYLFRDCKIVFKNGIYQENGEYYYYENNVKVQKGLVKDSDGSYRYFGLNYKAFRDGRYDLPKDKMNGLLPAGNYLFENFKIVMKNGVYEENGKLYYYIDNVKQKAGVVKLGEDYYYFGMNYYALADGNYYLPQEMMNGLLPAGNYLIKDGKIVFKNGIYVENGKTYFYRDNKKVKGAVKIGEDIYYFGANYYALADDSYYISADLLNGLLPAGTYRIENGIILKEGLVSRNGKLYYYENYKKKAGAVKVGDVIYYFGANTYTSLADGCYYISAELMNGLLPKGSYQIEDGKILKTGLVNNKGKLYYYENYAKKAGAVKVGDDIYYFGANTLTTLADGNYYISAELMNGLLPAGKYLIKDGKLQIKNGIYEEDGKLYYYENNAKVKKGLVLSDGDYYYFSMNYYALKDGIYTLPAEMMNGLLPAGKYTFSNYKLVR